MTADNFAYYQIAAKAIIKQDGKILVLTTRKGLFDFPGGRMDKSELGMDLSVVLARELREELGEDFTFTIQHLAFVANRSYAADGKTHHILAVFYEVDTAGGTIKLSDEHTASRWTEPRSLLANPEKFVSEDEYRQYKHYCDSLSY